MTLGLSVWNYRDYALVALALVEVNRSVNKCIKRVVLADSHVVTRVVLRAALANDDVTSQALLTAEDLNAESLSCALLLTAEDLNAESLSCALTTVLRTTYTFFMCHNVVLLRF